MKGIDDFAGGSVNLDIPGKFCTPAENICLVYQNLFIPDADSSLSCEIKQVWFDHDLCMPSLGCSVTDSEHFNPELHNR